MSKPAGITIRIPVHQQKRADLGFPLPFVNIAGIPGLAEVLVKTVKPANLFFDISHV
jgi:hypothetical protein